MNVLGVTSSSGRSAYAKKEHQLSHVSCSLQDAVVDDTQCRVLDDCSPSSSSSSSCDSSYIDPCIVGVLVWSCVRSVATAKQLPFIRFLIAMDTYFN